MFFDYINKLPKLDIVYTNSDYLDFLNWEEVVETAMTGVDNFKRKFIVIKFILNKDSKNPIKIMQTFFERYTNRGLWMGCGHATKNLIFTSGGINKQQFDVLNNILGGETIEIKNDMNCKFLFKEGTTVSLLNEK